MDSSLPSTLHEGEVDALMQDNLSAPQENGFINPQMLHTEIEPQSTTDDRSQSSSDTNSSENDIAAVIRRGFLPTGCCYDDRMKTHANADFSASPAHPEDPRRIEAIMQEFRDGGLVFSGSDRELQETLKTSPTRWMWRIPARKATKEEICTVHHVAHYDWVEQTDMMTSQELRSMTETFDMGRKSLYVGSLTYQAALISAGGAIETCKNVVAGNVKNAIAVIRPPGHHAEAGESMGFCIFNNVPIAASVCMTDYPETCRRVLILDWDVHHGNGIQNMFYSDPNVLYISIHVYRDGEFYPGKPEQEGLPDGGLDSCGAGPGIGKNINIGWHDQGMGDAEYMAAFSKVVMPVAQEFDPDLVIVSAGFDAAADDELGGCWVTPGCYSHMTHMLMSLADGKVAVCLEGGYNLKAISRSALAVAKTLMGEPPSRLSPQPINVEAASTIENVKRIHSQYWQCLKPGVVPMPDLQRTSAQRASDVMRKAQQHDLEQKHFMLPLYVQRDKLSSIFENQVLVTPEIYQAKKIFLILHDPPELLAQPDPLNNTVMSHNAYMNDGVMPYIDWAVSQGFGVIDINFPQSHLTNEFDDPFTKRTNEIKLQAQAKELLIWIWENHIETNAEAFVSILCIGDCYSGVKALLTSRDETIQKLTSVLVFLTGTLRPIRSETNPELATWYKNNSLIYVNQKHSCWSDEDNARKVRKRRFGRVEMSEVEGLRNMMHKYHTQGLEWTASKVNEWLERNNEESEEDDDEEEAGVGEAINYGVNNFAGRNGGGGATHQQQIQGQVQGQRGAVRMEIDG